jgi:hypothetical protein
MVKDLRPWPQLHGAVLANLPAEYAQALSGADFCYQVGSPPE